MNAIQKAKNNLLQALINFNVQCEKQGQNGLISTGIAEVIKAANSPKEIDFIIEKLKQENINN